MRFGGLLVMHLPQWRGQRYGDLGPACNASAPMAWSSLRDLGPACNTYAPMVCTCLRCIGPDGVVIALGDWGRLAMHYPKGVVVAMKVGTDLQCICRNGVVINRRLRESAYNDWPESKLRCRIYTWFSMSSPFLSNGATTISVF